MNNPAISIIVPIYNMEWCMRKCIDSILAQTFTDFECLLIDDGSTDSSPAICDEYEKKDSRIRVYHKPNGGLSDARNYGIERAQGEYTIFADPDDWVDARGLDQLFEKAKETNADMVMCDIFNNDPYQQNYHKQTPTSLFHYDVLHNLITNKISGFTVNKLIRKSLYQKYKIKYPKGMYGCEDQYTICCLLKNDIKIAYVPVAFYHYMHYNTTTQSTRYDDSTYALDKKIISDFTELFSDTPYKDLAYLRKTSYMVGHAFIGGYHFFSNIKFLNEFGQYEELLKQVRRKNIINKLYWISFRGHYHLARKIFSFLMQVNNIKKYFKSKIY